MTNVDFEYKIVVVPLPIDDNVLTAHMNELGADGWELVTTTVSNESRLWFKRENPGGGKPPNNGASIMAAVPIIYSCFVYPKNKTVPPYPATIIGYASIPGLGVGGGPIVPPPDIPVEPPLVIWPGPRPGHPIVLPGDPSWEGPDQGPPDQPPAQTEPPHEGWNWSVAESQWVYLYVPGPGTAEPKRR